MAVNQVEVIDHPDSDPDAIRWWEAYQRAEADEMDQLRTRAGSDDDHARCALARLLAEHGSYADAADLIRPLADEKLREVLYTPGGRIRPGLEAWLARQCDVEVIRVGAEGGDEDCQRRLARWHIRMAEYRRLAAAGDKHAQLWVEHWRGVSVS